MRKQVVPLLCLFFFAHVVFGGGSAVGSAGTPSQPATNSSTRGNFGRRLRPLPRAAGARAGQPGRPPTGFFRRCTTTTCGDAAVQKEFDQRAEALIQKADKRYSRNKRDAEAHFYLAQMHGVRAAYRYQYRNSLWGAARDGIKSKKYSDEFVKLHPYRADAYIALGLYNYYVDLAPSFVKVLRILLFLPGGSRSEGLEQLEHAAHAGELWAPQAQLELIQNLRLVGRPGGGCAPPGGGTAREISGEPGTSLPFGAALHQPHAGSLPPGCRPVRHHS